MKKFLIVCLAALAAISSYGQQDAVTRKVVPVLSEQNFYLNGGVRASMGGKSRVMYKVELPTNTVGWYYSFTTSLNEKGRQNLKLASQLTHLLDPTGVTQIATEALLAPSGVASADIYLFDNNNIGLFMQKADQNGGTYNYYISGSRENFKEGVVSINSPLKGTLFLGVKNPSAIDGINVSLEVAAIVEERFTIAKTEAQTKAELFGTMGWNAYVKRDYEKSIEHNKRALSLEQNLPWVKCNLSLCYLVQNKNEYLDSYIDAIACCKKSGHPREYLTAAVKDIKEALKTTPGILNANEILDLLDREIDAL